MEWGFMDILPFSRFVCFLKYMIAAGDLVGLSGKLHLCGDVYRKLHKDRLP